MAQLCLSLTLILGKSHFASWHLRLSASVKWLVTTWPRFLGGIVSCPSPADGRCERQMRKLFITCREGLSASHSSFFYL